eukprot:TRINITY_DN13537_c0_g1_i1.p1 TRINITY_DN13537_c0_g1~~TRINITY_DN13537_c0_g1_i1.p1  ORF type:complete len:100 (+),score=21.54 TRINITY_DN13537_c0_g1_i1:217-516(+)
MAKQVGLPTELNIGEFDLDSLLAIMTLDKKNLDDHLKVILLKEIGISYVQDETIAFFDDLENMQDYTIEETKSKQQTGCLLYTSPSPRDLSTSRMPSSA